MLICKYGHIKWYYNKYTLKNCNSVIYYPGDTETEIIVRNGIETIYVNVSYDGELVIPLIFDAIMECKDITEEFILSFNSKLSVNSKLYIGENVIVHEDGSSTSVCYLYRPQYHFNNHFYITVSDRQINIFIRYIEIYNNLHSANFIYKAIITYHDIITFMKSKDYNSIDEFIDNIRETHDRIINGAKMVKSARK